MSNSDWYRLGVVPNNSVENFRLKGWMLAYCPDYSLTSEGGRPQIGFFEGPTGHYDALCNDPVFWLTYRHRSYEVIDGRVVEKIPSEEWFERLCQEIGSVWFISMVYRMATGEVVPIQEIQLAYATSNNGAQMPHGPVRQIFRVRS